MKKFLESFDTLDIIAFIVAVICFITLLFFTILYIRSIRKKQLDAWKNDQSLSLTDHRWGEFRNEFKN